MKKITKIIIGTQKGDVRISRIKNGIPYDSEGKEVDRRLFKHNPRLLHLNFIDKEISAPIQNELVSTQ